MSAGGFAAGAGLMGSILSFAGDLMASQQNYAAQMNTNLANMQIAQKQMSWQQQENERAFQRDLQMWDLNNQYNSPQSQRERIEAAGGNAMLAFGNGVNITSGNSSTYPTLDPAKAITPEMKAYTGWNLGLNHIGEALGRLGLVEADINLKNAQAANTAADTAYKTGQKELFDETFGYQLELNREQVNNAKLDSWLKAQQYNYLENANELDKELKSNNIRLTQEEIKKVQAITRGYQINNDFQLFERDIQRQFGPRPKNEIVEAIWYIMQLYQRSQQNPNIQNFITR